MIDKEPLVQDFMTLQPQTIPSDESVQKAREIMTQYGIRHLPVTQDGVIVGVLSERDIHIATGIESTHPRKIRTGDVCSERIYTVSPETPLKDVADVMSKRNFGSALVMQDAKLVGIFTTVDACRALHQLIEKAVEESNIERLRRLRAYA